MWGTSTPILMKAERAMYVMSTMIAGAKTSICFAGSPYPSVLVIHNFLYYIYNIYNIEKFNDINIKEFGHHVA